MIHFSWFARKKSVKKYVQLMLQARVQHKKNAENQMNCLFIKNVLFSLLYDDIFF